MTEPNDDIEITIRGTRSQLHYEMENEYDTPFDYRPRSLRAIRRVIKITINDPTSEYMRVEVVKTAKQKQLETLDQQIADLQARRAELRGVSYWYRGTGESSGLYYRKVAGKETMQFFFNPDDGWGESKLTLEAFKGDWKQVDFADLPDEIKLIEKDCE